MKLLDALTGCNEGRPPIWLMRQAGRYLPQYRLLRSKYSLWEMFHESDIATQVTLMPIELFGMDAAILFSDILIILESFGLKICFPESGGPHLHPRIQNKEEIEKLPPHDLNLIPCVQETIKKVLKELTVPLIGFCGGPFTVATYCLEENHKSDLPITKKWIYQHPEHFHLLLKKITAATIDYLHLQIESGAQVIQIFDSWAGILSHDHFLEFSITYLKMILQTLKPKVPIILFTRGSSLYANELASLQPSAISFDSHLPLAYLRKKIPSTMAIQGNLDPDLLKAPPPHIQKTTLHLLDSLQGDKGFIVNLGHGVKPDTPVESVKLLVDIVKSKRN